MIGLGVHELQREEARDVLPGMPSPDPHPFGLVHREVENQAQYMPEMKAPSQEIS